MAIEVCVGDRVRDPMDDGAIREVESISNDGMTLHMTDGGVMGADEIKEVILPSETPLSCSGQ